MRNFKTGLLLLAGLALVLLAGCATLPGYEPIVVTVPAPDPYPYPPPLPICPHPPAHPQGPGHVQSPITVSEPSPQRLEPIGADRDSPGTATRTHGTVTDQTVSPPARAVAPKIDATRTRDTKTDAAVTPEPRTDQSGSGKTRLSPAQPALSAGAPGEKLVGGPGRR
jgi:hypothetical protein